MVRQSLENLVGGDQYDLGVATAIGIGAGSLALMVSQYLGASPGMVTAVSLGALNVAYGISSYFLSRRRYGSEKVMRKMGIIHGTNIPSIVGYNLVTGGAQYGSFLTGVNPLIAFVAIHTIGFLATRPVHIATHKGAEYVLDKRRNRS